LFEVQFRNVDENYIADYPLSRIVKVADERLRVKLESRQSDKHNPRFIWIFIQQAGFLRALILVQKTGIRIEICR
jgi:uncharacterized membrane protein